MYNYSENTTAQVLNTQILLCSDYASTARTVRAALEKTSLDKVYASLLQRIYDAFLYKGTSIPTVFTQLTFNDIVELADMFCKTCYNESAQVRMTLANWSRIQAVIAEKGLNQTFDLVHQLSMTKAFRKYPLSIAVFIANYCGMRNNLSPVVLNAALMLCCREYAKIGADIRLNAVLDNYARYREFLSDNVALAYSLYGLIVHYGRHRVLNGVNSYVLHFDSYTCVVTQASPIQTWNLQIDKSGELIGSVKYNPATMQLYGKQGITFEALDEVYQGIPYLTCTTSVSECKQFDRMVEQLRKYGRQMPSMLRTDTEVRELTIGKRCYRYIAQSEIETVEALYDNKVVAIYDRDEKHNVYFNDILAEDDTEEFNDLLEYNLPADENLQLGELLLKYIESRDLYAMDIKTIIVNVSQYIESVAPTVYTELSEAIKNNM